MTATFFTRIRAFVQLPLSNKKDRHSVPLAITFQRPAFLHGGRYRLYCWWVSGHTRRRLAQGLPLWTPVTATPIAPGRKRGRYPCASPFPPPSWQANYTVTLRQLGALFPLQLRGVDGTSGVQFSVRADEVVTAAQLQLHFAYSPALLL